MRIAITGATGLIGGHLVSKLEGRGDEVVRITRGPAQPPKVWHWDPSSGQLDGSFEGIDAVINLAGENISGGRWTDDFKRRLMESRVQSTDLVARKLAEAGRGVLVSASAIGYYGDRGDTWLDESAEPGDLYMSKICIAWEAAAEPARQAGLRVVHPRIGVVMTSEGGALGKMLLPFKMGVGGKVGSGRQYMSWVGLEDVVEMLIFCLDREVEGPLNLVGPEPVTNQQFTRTLGRALNRPTVLPFPAVGAKALFGQMGEELLLSSARVSSRKIQELGYTFRHPDLTQALAAALSHSSAA